MITIFISCIKPTFVFLAGQPAGLQLVCCCYPVDLEFGAVSPN